ncbi:hypothetical protein ABPG74_013100 [Tetrahymena malaccensis]
MKQNKSKRDIIQMDLEDLERQIESELQSLQSFENNMTNRSGASSNLLRQPSSQCLNQVAQKNAIMHQAQDKNQQVLAPRSKNSFAEALNRQRSTSQLNNDIKQLQSCNQNKIVEPSNQQKERNKNLFTIEDLKSEEAKKTVCRRSKSPISSKMASRRNDYKSDKENQVPSSAFQSGRTVTSNRSNDYQTTMSSNKRGNQSQNVQIQNQKQNKNNNNTKTQQQRLQQQSQQIRQNIFDLIQNDKFDSAETNENQNEQILVEDNTYSNQIELNQDGGYYFEPMQNNQYHNYYDNRENINYINLTREDDEINKLIASKIPSQQQKNLCTFETANSGFTSQGMRKNQYQTQETTTSSQLRRSQSNLNCASSRHSQVRLSKNSGLSQAQSQNKTHYVDENCTFKPVLSKKSMEMAGKMEDPKVRLTQPKNEEKINKLRSSLESQYSYRPKINRSSERNFTNIQQESFFNYSDEDEEGNNYQNEDDFSLKLRQSSQNSQKVPRWQKLYEKHKVYQMEKEIKLIQKEKEEQEDPELTFQPRLFRSKDSNYMYGESDYDINQRCQIWAQKRQEKLKKVAEQFENRDLIGCTFQPNAQSVKNGLNQQSVTSSSQYGNQRNVSYNNQSDFSQQITEFNKKGIIEFFERIDAAKKKKIENEQLQNKITGKSWQNKITIPQEFSFMKKGNESHRSTSTIRQSKFNSSTTNKSRNNSKSPSNINQNKIMLFYKTRSLSSNNLCQIDPDENQVYQEISSSINNWDKVKENLHKHIHQIQI